MSTDTDDHIQHIHTRPDAIPVYTPDEESPYAPAIDDYTGDVAPVDEAVTDTCEEDDSAFTDLFAVPQDPEDPIDWNDLEVLYKSVAETIGATAYGVNELLKVPGITQGVDYPAELAITVSGLNKDLNHFADKLVEIHQQHEGQTGVITEQDQYIDYLSIGDQYRIVAEEFMAITAPAMMTVTSHVAPFLQEATTDTPTTPTDGATDDAPESPTTTEEDTLDV